MRGEQDIIQLAEAMGGKDRFADKTVDGSSCDAPILQGIKEGVFIDDPSPRRVDEIGSRLHQAQFLRADEIAGFVVEQAMDGDEIGFGEKLGQWDQGNIRGFIGGEAGVGIESEGSIHAEGAEELNESPADSAEPDDPEGSISEFGSEELGTFVPLAGAEEMILGFDMMGEGEHPADGGFRHGPIDCAGRDKESDISMGASWNVHAVETHSEAADGEKVVLALERFTSQAGGEDDHAIGIGELIRADDIFMLSKARDGNVRVAFENVQADVREARGTVGVEKIGR